MFTADLSWADDTTEKVGERRQRKIHDGSESITSSGSSNNRRPSTRKGSLSGKTSFSSVKGSFRRPPTAASKHVRKHTLPPIDANTTLKDPLEQPDFILSGKYIPKLPSGTHLDGDPPPPFAAEANQNTLEHGRILYSRHESGSRKLSQLITFTKPNQQQRMIPTRLGLFPTRRKLRPYASPMSKSRMRYWLCVRTILMVISDQQALKWYGLNSRS
jgi:hypothetical protein